MKIFVKILSLGNSGDLTWSQVIHKNAEKMEMGKDSSVKYHQDNKEVKV